MAHSSWLATLVISVAFFHVLVAGAPSPLTQQLINKGESSMLKIHDKDLN